MSFLIQTIDGVRVTLREIRERELRIGRGANAQVRSDNPAVALEHAVIRGGAHGWEIVDRGSITGTYVSGTPVETAKLERGDVIAVGDLKLSVQAADPGKPLFLRLERLAAGGRAAAPGSRSAPSQEEPAEESAGAVAAAKVDYARAYALPRGFWNKATATLAATVLVFVAVASVAARGELDAFAPGPIAVAHAAARLPDGSPLFGASGCGRCHEAFGGPSDARCQECHARAFHQARLAKLGECSRCHAEHRDGARLASVHQAECLACHRDLAALGTPIVVAASITGFAKDHPQLTLTIDRGAVSERVHVDAAAARRLDARGLRFNHECHLTGKCRARAATLADPRRAEERLDCTSCHRVDPNDGSIVALRYEESCARCHPLTFDNRFPPVPHGVTLEAIAGVIGNAYAGNRELLTKTPAEVARIFSQSGRQELDLGSATVRNAQRVLRVRCEQCHAIAGMSVQPVSVSRRWFPGMKPFNHATHLGKGLETKCETCHGGAERSSTAADVLMPRIEDCRACHQDAGTARTANLGGCVTCHYYHMETARTGPGWTARDAAPARIARASLMPGGPGRPSQGAVRADQPRGPMLIMIGLLVVLALITAAIIVWSRMRGEEAIPQSLGLAERSVAQAAPVAAPPAAQPSAPPPAPAAAPPPVPEPSPQAAAPAPEPTVAVKIASIAPPAAGGTTIVQWVGSLVGVEGPFAGRRIPIDPDGFYIGRDKEMATVVVDDARVSRRHVWIGAKNGKAVAIEQGSTNGTFLGSVGSAPITEVELKKGDVLILADNAASFRYEP